MITVINIIPNALSGETNQDSEPNIAVNPANSTDIAITAFTPDPLGGTNAPIFVSTNGGSTWVLNTIVPSQTGSSTGDIVPRFGTTGGRFYAGILRRPGSLRLNILRSANFSMSTAMTVLVDRNQVDQPFVQAMTVPAGQPNAGNDRVYVGLNDFAATGGRTATIEQSLNAGATTPTFASIRIETRGTGTAGQNGPQIRPAIHTDGTVYALFYGWRAFNSSSSQVTTDVVVARDDNWGSGTTPFSALTDPSDGLAGRLVQTGVQFTWDARLGQERLGGDLSIAVDPTNSSIVYIAFCDVQTGSYTIHIRRSTDRGVTWSADLRTITNAKNPALAINSVGRVGFAYQQVTGTGTSSRWETHLELTNDAFTSVVAHTLATVPATTPTPTFLPYIGDYMHMMAVGATFYGVFSANNVPDLANFPEGVTYLRNHDFTTGRLLAVDGTTEVPPSIDPFFFTHTEMAITRLTRLTRLTRFTRLTRLTSLTRFTRLTRLTRLTRFTELTRLTRFTRFTELTRLTRLTRFTEFTRFTRFTRFPPEVTRLPGPPIEPGPEMAPAVTPFVRFGNVIFAPEDLLLSRFDELAGVVDELQAAGFEGLHHIVMANAHEVAEATGYTLTEAAELIKLAQHLMRITRL